MQTGFAFTKFADRLASIADVTPDDLDLLARMPSTISHHSSHENIRRKGDRPSSCALLLQGYLCWRDVELGYGQITSIHVPGDAPDLHGIEGSGLDANLSALGPVVVAFVSHDFFRHVSRASPGLCRALSLAMLADASLLRNWIVNLGSRDSLTRVAHLICEIGYRLRAVGLARDDWFASPFTQSDLAAACGISAVHANRIIQELRRRRLLQWQSRTITILDWPALVRLAGFRPDYLGLRDPHSPDQHQAAETLATADCHLLASQ
ncbi:Crp/Fnr family transcriptional regulator [Bradyrhizobium sp.]|uniref:Crp/Fnr family transcriptional regulator n=1 Tax=Bradyrhizobium sp. TaxID=376 RepID=UPI001D1E7FED|nr:Crp/Fnr family transcriptional regulator [Bradyrhizobium sp.]MBV8922964.1 Crp/Fnr family transcriptional regulator [Bradyrhizobium sp.]MBV9981035.1 Crp/Fnr family transcriptional regulator [Bradyrhizobium sp.]